MDANGEMVAVARERGLEVAESDALAYLESLPDGSLGGLIATQVVEHLEPAYLMRLLDDRVAQAPPGGPDRDRDDQSGLLARLLQQLPPRFHARAAGAPRNAAVPAAGQRVRRVTIRYSAPVPDHMKMQPIDLPAEMLAAADPASRALVDTSRVVNANAAILNNLLFTHLDYAAIGYRS